MCKIRFKVGDKVSVDLKSPEYTDDIRKSWNDITLRVIAIVETPLEQGRYIMELLGFPSPLVEYHSGYSKGDTIHLNDDQLKQTNKFLSKHLTNEVKL